MMCFFHELIFSFLQLLKVLVISSSVNPARALCKGVSPNTSIIDLSDVAIAIKLPKQDSNLSCGISLPNKFLSINSCFESKIKPL